jgi:hypothetical protein
MKYALIFIVLIVSFNLFGQDTIKSISRPSVSLENNFGGEDTLQLVASDTIEFRYFLYANGLPGVPVQNAEIILFSNGDTIQKTTTNSNGYARFQNLNIEMFPIILKCEAHRLQTLYDTLSIYHITEGKGLRAWGISSSMYTSSYLKNHSKYYPVIVKAEVSYNRGFNAHLGAGLIWGLGIWEPGYIGGLITVLSGGIEYAYSDQTSYLAPRATAEFHFIVPPLGFSISAWHPFDLNTKQQFFVLTPELNLSLFGQIYLGFGYNAILTKSIQTQLRGFRITFGWNLQFEIIRSKMNPYN